MTSRSTIAVATIIARTSVEGPGVRSAIWLKSLKPQHDPSEQIANERSKTDLCHHEFVCTPEELAQEVVLNHVSGVTLLGGEPFDQASALADFARLIQKSGLTIMIYSAWGFAQIKSRALDDRGVRMLLTHTDLLITGALAQWSPDKTRRWVGSVNQNVHFLSDAYKSQDPLRSRCDSVHHREVHLHEDVSQDDTRFEIVTHGWPHRHPERVQVMSALTMNVSQAQGLQWLDDLFQRESLDIILKCSWTCDDHYWSVALDRARKRCARWILDMNRGARLPRLINGQLLEVSVLDLDPQLHPLRFGSDSAALLAGPTSWRASLKQTWDTDYTRLQHLTPRWIDPDDSSSPYLGDGLLLGSLWTKLTRHRVSVRVCQDLMRRPRKEHHKLRLWLIQTSPFCALLDLSEGVDLMISTPTHALPSDLDHWISLVSPSLPQWWRTQLRHERLPNAQFTADGWRFFSKISALGRWAAEHEFFPLGEACISTISSVLSELEPESFFKVIAPSMDQVYAERSHRLQICQSHRWRSLIERAHQSSYGDGDYLNAQLTLRYATRWRPLWATLDRFERYGSHLLNTSKDEIPEGTLSEGKDHEDAQDL